MRTNITECPGMAKVSGPYSLATRVSAEKSEIIFVSGTTPDDPAGNVVGKGDAARQAEHTLQNIAAVLAAAGGSLSDIVKLTIFLTNIQDRKAVNEVRTRIFGDNRPAATLVEVSKLVHPDWLIEIEAIAVVPSRA